MRFTMHLPTVDLQVELESESDTASRRDRAGPGDFGHCAQSHPPLQSKLVAKERNLPGRGWICRQSLPEEPAARNASRERKR